MQVEGGFIVEDRYSAWQKKKVRTILVNARSKTLQQRSINAALGIARPFDRIELAGGEYPEAVTVQFPIELVASEGEDPQIVSRNAGITFTANIDAYVENLNITSRSTSGKLDGAVVVMAGSPTIKNCLLSSVVIGGAARPTLLDCTIAGSASGSGVVIQDAGGGTIRDCTIRQHRTACLDVDTRGELLVTQCTLANEGADVVVMSASNSSVALPSSSAMEAGLQLLRCSGVSLFQNRIYVDSLPTVVDANGVSGGLVANTAGCPCCVIISNGAAPTCESNELLEGEVGVMLDGSGPAQLKGNKIRCQRRCGVLALVEEGFAYQDGHQSLRIAGDNVLDRCYIGIDVQCRGNQRDVFAVPADGRLSNALPHAKRAFQWLPAGVAFKSHTARAASASADVEGPNEVDGELAAEDVRFLYDGTLTTPATMKSALAKLIELTLRAHPTCLQPSFTIATGNMTVLSSATAGTFSYAAGASLVGELLTSMLGVNLKDKVSDHARQADSAAAMLELRGNRGVDIVKTKFSNCTLCAVRFGKQSYGLVEDCAFEDCGLHAVIVEAAAHPLITGCRFQRSRGASLVLTNYAHPLVVGNEIATGQVHGVEIANMSRGIFAGNLITGNRGSGVRVAQWSETILCGNMIAQNRNGGVYTTEASKPLILANRLTTNAMANVVCTGGSDAFIALNSTTSSTDAGMLFTDCSRATVLGNHISVNGDGIVVELDADPVVMDNTISENTRSGVLARNNALGSFTRNKLTRNSGPNFIVMEGADPHVRSNDIMGGGNGGIVVVHEGLGRFEHNNIGENAVANAMVVDPHSNPVFRRNNLHSSTSGCGVVCARGAAGTFKDNNIHENKQAGVYLTDGANPMFDRNTVSREAVGIVLSNAGRGHFVDNRIEGCVGAGVISQHEAEPLFERNTVRKNGMSGLLIAPDGLGKFFENTFEANDIGVQLGSSLPGASLELTSVYLTSNARSFTRASSASMGSVGTDGVPSRASSPVTVAGAAGAMVRRRSSSFFSPAATAAGGGVGRSVLQEVASAVERRRASTVRSTACQISRNDIVHNTHGGVLLEYRCNGIMEDNNICENGDHGVRANIGYTAQRAQAIAEERFAVTAASPLVPTAPPLPQRSAGEDTTSLTSDTGVAATLSKNRICKHHVANIAFEAFSEGSGVAKLVENDIHTAPMGMLVTNHSHVPLAERNEIHHCMDGVYMECGGTGTFVGNRIRACHLCGVYVSTDADPHFVRENVAEACGLCGVLIDAQGRGRFTQGSMRRCGLAGVIAFAGATTPYHVSYDEVRQAGIVSATPAFEENVIEENNVHGVLVLSVIQGSPLRTQRDDAKRFMEEGRVHFPAVPPPHTGATAAVASYGSMSGVSAATTNIVTRGERLCAYFGKNTIQKNQLCGVFHDRFDHWDLENIFDGASSFRMTGGRPAETGDTLDSTLASARSTRRTAPPSLLPKPSVATSPERGIKNAYGGYEILLGTSQIIASGEHHRQRELKQVTFTENVISHSSIGVAAGYGCHPFLLRNKIVDNVFIGLLLRFGSAVMASQCEVARNGLAGVHAASGAKGFFTKGTIKENNGLCRPAGRPNEPRSFDAVMAKVILSDVTKATDEAGDVTELDALSPHEVLRLQRASEQLTELATVHGATVRDGVRVLWETACASSVGIAMASGCEPSSLTTGSDDARSRQAQHTPSLGGVGVHGYIRLSVADGGLGLWIEEGSRVSLSESTVEGNAHAGVYFSTGIAKQHRVLHKFFSMSGDGTGAFQAAASPMGVGPIKATKNGVLSSTASQTCRDASSPMDAMFATGLEYPLLASRYPAVLFTSHGLCASGVQAAAAAAQRGAGLLSASDLTLEASFNGFSSTTASSVFDAAGADHVQRLSEPPTPRTTTIQTDGVKGDSDNRNQRIDSIHCASIVDNVIANNGEYGVFVELTQTMKTGQRRAAEDAPSTTKDELSLSSNDVAILSGGDALTSQLDFHIIVEGNTICGNGVCGVLCQHVVNISATGFVASRGALRDLIQKDYDTIRADLVLRRGSSSSSGVVSPTWEKPLPFTTYEVPQTTHRALLLGNELFGNGALQAEVTSRYTVATTDGTRTLLQFDTCAELSTSPFSSHVLARLPVTAALLATPPTTLSLWERNRLHSGKGAFRVCGLLGAASVRLQYNRFDKLSEDAVCVEGHLASCTLGVGNTFRDCGVGVRVRTDVTGWRGTRREPPGKITLDARAPNDLRTRIFGNVFVSSTQASVLVDRCAGDEVLIQGNDFRQHPYGTTGLFLTNRATGGVRVRGNTFRDSFSPVVIAAVAGGGGDSQSSSPNLAPAASSSVFKKDDSRSLTLGVSGSAANTRSSHTLVDNSFVGNFIGLIACHGAAPRIVRNMFDGNQHAGMEIVGLSTRPVVEGCVFRRHRRPVEQAADTPATASAPPALVAVTSSSSSPLFPGSGGASATSPPMRFPDSGTITLFSGTFSVDLVAGNRQVLSPNSQICLPCGVLLGPYAECDITGSLFTENDVGLDAARIAVPPSLAITNSVAATRECVFHGNTVAGVLVRHPGDASRADQGRSKVQVKVSSASTAPSDAAPIPETTLVTGCFFTANHTTADLSGDVLAMRDGFAVFRGNTFFGTIQCHADSAALFTSNMFLSDHGDMDGDDSDVEEAALPSTLNVMLPSLVLHEGTKATVEDNVIAFRRRGLLACPAANGQVRRNCFIACSTAVTVAPYNHTVIADNRLLRSRDCAILAYGGLVTGNDIFDAPTGLVLQPPAQYKAFNAIPSHKRNANDVPLCTRNSIAACGGDGILVACSASVEGNVVSKCQSGINVVCPATMEMTAAASGVAGLSGPPKVSGNTVYDCATGVLLNDGSAAHVTSNDIFDNDFTGVLVLGSAVGTLQNNTISCANEHGAVEIPPDCRVKTLGNVIRNQFSPAYNRTTRANRAKDHVAKRDAIDEDVKALEQAINMTLDKSALQLKTLSALPSDIANRIANAPTAKGGHAQGGGSSLAAGMASRGFLRRAIEQVRDSDGVAHDVDDKHQDAEGKEQAREGSRGAPGRAQSLPNAVAADKKPRRQISAGTQRTSQTAAQARKKAAETKRTSLSSVGTSSPTATTHRKANESSADSGLSGDVKHVVIHVFARPSVANAHTAGLALGEAVARVLAAPPLSRMQLSTTITTSTSHLASTLRSLKMPPFLMLAVMDNADEVGGDKNTSAQEAMFLLSHAQRTGEATAQQHKRARRPAQQHLLYFIHPSTLALSSADANRPDDTSAVVSNLMSSRNASFVVSDANTSGTGAAAPPMATARQSISEFVQNVTRCVPFRTGVEDALGPLTEALAEDMAHPKSVAATKDGAARHRRQSTATVLSPHEMVPLEGTPQTTRSFPEDSEDEGDDGASPVHHRSAGQRTATGPFRTAAEARTRESGPVLSRERIGELLSKLTPEALGYSSPEAGAKKAKRRRSSVASSTGRTPTSGAPSRTASIPRRKSSVSSSTGKAAPGGGGGKSSPNGKRKSIASSASNASSPTGRTAEARRRSLASVRADGLPPLAQHGGTGPARTPVTGAKKRKQSQDKSAAK